MAEKPTMKDIRNKRGLTISNTMAAAALGMKPDRLAAMARAGELPWHVIISGNRVKHSKHLFADYWDPDRKDV